MDNNKPKKYLIRIILYKYINCKKFYLFNQYSDIILDVILMRLYNFKKSIFINIKL
jgi:hypothetical protein